ncbi:MAG: molybdopterin dinucleotide binding domain-containing protein [Pseudonocardiaceae bacterium]
MFDELRAASAGGLADYAGISYERIVADTIRADTVFVPFHWPEVNVLTNPALDPISRMPEFKVCAVAVSALPGHEP